MSDCVFCKIVAGEIPSHKVWEDDHVLAIMDIGHVNPGHTLVLSKAHADTMMDLDEAVAGQAFVVANRIAKLLDVTFAPDGITILQANRPVGFQTVFHFHLHVLPRHANDGVTLTWPGKNPPQEELAERAAMLHAGLRR